MNQSVFIQSDHGVPKDKFLWQEWDINFSAA